MKPLRQIFILIAVALVSVALIGCGGGKEDYEKTVSELNSTKAELAQANARIAELEKSLKARAELQGAMKKPEVVIKTAAVDKAMKDKLAAAQKEATDLRTKVASLTSENNRLQGLLEKMKAQVADLQNKLGGMQAPTTGSPTDLLKKR